MSRTYLLLVVGLSLICLILVGFIFYGQSRTGLISPLGSSPTSPTLAQKPLQKYAFRALESYTPVASPIILSEVLTSDPDFTAYRFTYQTEAKTMSGQINVPTQATPSAGFPVILMIRGFVDPSIYQTGVGTQSAAAFFANHGFVTLAPDFLGYGTSDPPDPDVMGERLQKPLHLLDLLASLNSLVFIRPNHIGIWAHSNGGQIALSLLEITTQAYPAVLWAPVTKPFPYSILYYTDESEDQGKALRAKVAEFETIYDVYDYSIDRYFDRIQAPLLVHQGTADDAVPLEWSQDFVKRLQSLDKDVTLYTYPGSDHNLRQSWDTVIARDLDFFLDHLNLDAM